MNYFDGNVCHKKSQIFLTFKLFLLHFVTEHFLHLLDSGFFDELSFKSSSLNSSSQNCFVKVIINFCFKICSSVVSFFKIQALCPFI